MERDDGKDQLGENGTSHRTTTREPDLGAYLEGFQEKSAWILCCNCFSKAFHSSGCECKNNSFTKDCHKPGHWTILGMPGMRAQGLTRQGALQMKQAFARVLARERIPQVS